MPGEKRRHSSSSQTSRSPAHRASVTTDPRSGASSLTKWRRRINAIPGHLHQSPDSNSTGVFDAFNKNVMALAQGRASDMQAAFPNYTEEEGIAEISLPVGIAGGVGSFHQGLQGVYEAGKGLRSAISGSESERIYGERSMIKGAFNSAKGGTELIGKGLELAEQADASKVTSGILGVVSAGRNARKAVHAKQRASRLRTLEKRRNLTGTNKWIANYAAEKGKKMMARSATKTAATSLGLGALGTASNPVTMPIAPALAAGSAAVGLGLGVDKISNWAIRKYQAAKKISELKRDHPSPILSVLRRGKTKLGKELEELQRKNGYNRLERMTENPTGQRRIAAQTLLENIHDGGKNHSHTKKARDARAILKALGLPHEVRSLILSNKESASNDEIIQHVMQKMRSNE